MKPMESLMSILSLAGVASTAGLAVFALVNVAVQGSNNPNIPDEPKAITVSAPTISTPSIAAPIKSPRINSVKSAEKIADVQVAANADDEEEDVVAVATDPPARSDEEQARINKLAAALKEAVKGIDYERARYHPIHFKPLIDTASNEECLVCHEEIMTRKPRDASPAGLKAKNTLAWYQTLDTYLGDQESFHYRHLQSPFATKVMNLSCNFCHKGNDPREESPDMQPGKKVFTASTTPNFTLRKMVNPSKTCLRCHGSFPFELMDGVEGPWHEVRVDMEDEETPNGCLVCHEETFRTVRHQVNYLKAASIEEAAKAGSDVCLGCHGGRQWYRITYPYPRHPWPDMDTEETPEWAKKRPATSLPEDQIKAAK
jgi:hypothetical protein